MRRWAASDVDSVARAVWAAKAAKAALDKMASVKKAVLVDRIALAAAKEDSVKVDLNIAAWAAVMVEENPRMAV